LIWTLAQGFLIKEAYSTTERTKAEYTDNLEYGTLNNKVFRLIKPNIAYAFVNIKFRCFSNRNLSSTNTPRSTISFKRVVIDVISEWNGYRTFRITNDVAFVKV